MSKNRLNKNEDLRRGAYLTSNNGLFTAVFKDDSNFVIYRDGKPLWASDTSGSGGTRLSMQADSNLVMFNDANTARWDTDTYVPMPPHPSKHYTRHDCHLELTDEGILALHRGPDKPWNSSQSNGVKRYKE